MERHVIASFTSHEYDFSRLLCTQYRGDVHVQYSTCNACNYTVPSLHCIWKAEEIPKKKCLNMKNPKATTPGRNIVLMKKLVAMISLYLLHKYDLSFRGDEKIFCD